MQWKLGSSGSHAQRAAELTRQLSRERAGVEVLRLEKDSHAQLAQRALADAAKARESREDVRRVLAAAVANEKRAEEEVAHVRKEANWLMGEVQTAERVRGEADGRLGALELRLVEERQAAERRLSEANDRAWALSAEHGDSMQRVIAEREQARIAERAMAQQLPMARRAASARALLTIAAVCLGFAALLLPGLLGRLGGDERARLLDGFTAIDAKLPLYAFAALCLAAIGSMGWGLFLLHRVSGPYGPSRTRSKFAGEPGATARVST